MDSPTNIIKFKNQLWENLRPKADWATIYLQKIALHAPAIT